MASSTGEVPSAATASAGAMPAASSVRPSSARSAALARNGVCVHGVIGDPRAVDPAARERQLGGDRKHRDALGVDAGDFRGTGTPRAAGRLNATLDTSAALRSRRPRNSSSGSSRWPKPPANTTGRIEREQSCREIAVGRCARTDCRRPSPPRAPPARRPRALPDAETPARARRGSPPW